MLEVAGKEPRSEENRWLHRQLLVSQGSPVPYQTDSGLVQTGQSKISGGAGAS